MNLVQVPTKNIEEVWHIVVKDIADALARSNGYALADHIKKWILEEKMQLWILWDQDSKEKYFGTVVTEVITRPLQRCLNIRIMTGKHREKWQHLIKHIEEFAWQNKCDLLELVARPGWKKILKPFGYKESHILLEKKKETIICHQEDGAPTTVQSTEQYNLIQQQNQDLIRFYLKLVLYTDKAQKQQDMLHQHNKLYKVWVHQKLLQVLQINKY